MKILSRLLGIAFLLSFFLFAGISLLAPNFVWLGFYGLLFSFLLLVVWAVLNRQSLGRFFTHKSTIYGMNLAFIVVLVFGILFFINILAKDYHWRKDVTSKSIHSLSAQSLKVLSDLKQDINVYYFNSQEEKDRLAPLFSNYKYQSKHFLYQFVDTAKQPTLTQTMEVKRNDTVVFSLSGSLKKVKVEGASEEKITNGLIKLLRSKDQIIYFLQGHGEPSLNSPEGEPNGLSRARAELEKQGYLVKELNLLSAGAIPQDASALMIIAPKTEFFPKELEILSSWIKSNGKALLAFDLDLSGEGLSKGEMQLLPLLNSYSLEMHNTLLVDPTSKAANVEPQILLGFANSKEHPITKDFPTSKIGLLANFFFPLTTHITAKPQEDFEISSLAKTSEQAWAVSDWKTIKSGQVAYQAGKDKKGNLDLAFAVQGKKNAVRLGVFANGRFLTNQVIDKAGNRDLFLNTVAWLTNDEQLISIRANDEDSDQLQVNNSIITAVFLLVVILMPLLTLGAGIYVWWRRSKQ